MNMLGASARLLRLLSLFQAQRYWSGADLAARLAVTPRTLRRDVDRLRSLGYPVHSTSGAAGGYQLGAGATLPPLLLDDEEAVAVAVSLRTAAGGTVAGIEEASVRALLKLEQVLPSRLRRRVSALNAFIVPMAPAGPSVDAGVLSRIAAACRDREGLRFGYQSRTAEVSRRNVEPHRLVHTGRRWYLVAWDLDRGDWRTFRVDRIEPKFAAGPRFRMRPQPEGGFAGYVAKSVGYAPYLYRASVLLHAPAAAIAARVPPAAAQIEAVSEKTCMLHTGASSLDMLAVHLAMTGVEFEVREPAELIEHVRKLGQRFMRAASCGIID